MLFQFHSLMHLFHFAPASLILPVRLSFLNFYHHSKPSNTRMRIHSYSFNHILAFAITTFVQQILSRDLAWEKLTTKIPTVNVKIDNSW